LKTARLAPYLFVFLWSTGFVGAKYGLPYADPFIFLSLRIFIAAGILFIAARIMHAQIALTRSEISKSALIGFFLHASQSPREYLLVLQPLSRVCNLYLFQSLL